MATIKSVANYKSCACTMEFTQMLNKYDREKSRSLKEQNDKEPVQHEKLINFGVLLMFCRVSQVGFFTIKE